MTSFFDNNLLRDFRAADFTDRAPFPWTNFSHILTPDAWTRLYAEFPPLTQFESHSGIQRDHNQRSHDRYYLAYETSIYQPGKEREAGVVHHNELSPAWQDFLTELQNPDAPYRAFIQDLLQTGELTPRFAWHVGHAGSEVSPHRDADNKLGTHIFYFNTSEDWDMAWGGSTLVLDNKKVSGLNPDFSDFENEEASEIRDNHSFLFKNTQNAWHGAKALTCPPTHHRRLFNVIFHEATPTVSQAKADSLSNKLRSVFGRK